MTILNESIDEDLYNQRNEVNTNPSEKQKKAGNYKMGHITINGFNITIENPKGSYRSGTDPNGKKWKTFMHNDYGYFTRTKGKDGDAIDVFIGNDLESEKIFAVDQKVNGKFDETKIMFCFNSKEQAKEAYMSNYDDDWKGFWKITEVSRDIFKKWLYDGHRQKKPFFDYVEIKNNKINENMDNIISEKQLKKIVSEVINEAYTFGNYFGRKRSIFPTTKNPTVRNNDSIQSNDFDNEEILRLNDKIQQTVKTINDLNNMGAFTEPNTKSLITNFIEQSNGISYQLKAVYGRFKARRSRSTNLAVQRDLAAKRRGMNEGFFDFFRRKKKVNTDDYTQSSIDAQDQMMNDYADYRRDTKYVDDIDRLDVNLKSIISTLQSFMQNGVFSGKYTSEVFSDYLELCNRVRGTLRSVVGRLRAGDAKKRNKQIQDYRKDQRINGSKRIQARRQTNGINPYRTRRQPSYRFIAECIENELKKYLNN